jgi:hypothetical protein
MKRCGRWGWLPHRSSEAFQYITSQTGDVDVVYAMKGFECGDGVVILPIPRVMTYGNGKWWPDVFHYR